MTVEPVENYAFPFRIDPLTGQTTQARYAEHVDQMIRQVLLTDPGERTDLPTFGCGVRAMVFQPVSAALVTSAQILVRQALDEWLAGIIQVLDVNVLTEDFGVIEPAAIEITISYVIVETQGRASTTVTLI